MEAGSWNNPAIEAGIQIMRSLTGTFALRLNKGGCVSAMQAPKCDPTFLRLAHWIINWRTQVASFMFINTSSQEEMLMSHNVPDLL